MAEGSKAAMIIDTIDFTVTLNTLYKSLEQAVQSGKAKKIVDITTFKIRAGTNTYSFGLRGNASGVGTGSAFVIIVGAVMQFEVIGID